MRTSLNLREAREHLYRLVGQLAAAPWEPIAIRRKEGERGEVVVAVVVSPVLWRKLSELALKQPLWPPEVVSFLTELVAWQQGVQAVEESGLRAALAEAEAGGEAASCPGGGTTTGVGNRPVCGARDIP